MSKDNVRDILKKKAEQRETEAEGMVVRTYTKVNTALLAQDAEAEAADTRPARHGRTAA